MWIGTLFALAAGLMWGLVFVGPLWLHDYPAVLLSFGRYLAFGLIALPLAWLDRTELRRLKRADWLGADELDVTVGYLGDTTTPNFLRRTDRLNDTNYWQVLVAKKQGRLGWSTDLTSLADVRTWRAAMTAKVPSLRVVDLVRGEAYHRFDGDASGFAVAAVYDARDQDSLGLAEILPHLSWREPGRSWRHLRRAPRRRHNPSILAWKRLLDAGVP